MTALAQRLVREALDLDDVERAEVAAAILSSLEETGPPPSTEWLAEIERRARRVLSGESRGTPWEEVHDRLAASLKR